MKSLDTETTGLDLFHGCKPFIVTLCNEDLENTCWVWDVDPLTREPIIPEEDLDEIAEEIDGEDLAFINPVFDVLALSTVRKEFGTDWDWSRTHDIGMSGHIKNSNQKPRTLTAMALRDLGIDVNPLELAVAKATKAARNLAKKEFPDWDLAYEGHPKLPSCKDGGKGGDAEGIKVWKNDMWVPRAIAKALKYDASHPWWTVAEEYANGDTAVTLPIHKQHMNRLKELSLIKVYQERLKLLPVMYKMASCSGVTLNKSETVGMGQYLEDEHKKTGEELKAIAKEFDYELELPKGSANNNSIKEFAFDVLKLPVVAYTKKKNPSLGTKTAVPIYQTTLEKGTPQHRFLDALVGYKGSGSHISYVKAYQKYWIPLGPKRLHNGKIERLWYCLHPGLNPVAADTLRWSSSNPNSQNVSKKGRYNLRKCFGPAPGREWWSCDAKNVELRIPAYESGEQDLIQLFEAPKEPPFYGSEHLLNFSVVYPDLWEQVVNKEGLDKAGPWIKDNWDDSWYQWCKNGDFAVQYGAIDRTDGEGTADKAFHRAGSHARLKSRFAKKEALNQHYIGQARDRGYVETLPDRTVDPERGYPLYCTLNNYGGILETVPLNYHVQSTAMWVTMRAMILSQEYLDGLNEHLRPENHYHLILQVHDEIIFDFPKKKQTMGNLPIVRDILDIIGNIGYDLIPAMPLPFGAKRHDKSWATGVTVA